MVEMLIVVSELCESNQCDELHKKENIYTSLADVAILVLLQAIEDQGSVLGDETLEATEGP